MKVLMSGVAALVLGLAGNAEALAAGPKPQSGSHGSNYRKGHDNRGYQNRGHDNRRGSHDHDRRDGHKDYRGYDRHHNYRDYHRSHGVKFEHGYYYKGQHHEHWSHRVWDSRFGRHHYYDPFVRGYFYWHAGHGRYYPLSYSGR